MSAPGRWGKGKWICGDCNKTNGRDDLDRRNGTPCNRTDRCRGEFGPGARLVFSDEELGRHGPLHQNSNPFFRYDEASGYVYAVGGDDPVANMAMDRPWHGPSHAITPKSRRPWARQEDLDKLPPIAKARIDFHFEEGERLERGQEQMPPPPAPTASTQGQSGNDCYTSQGATAEYGSTYRAMYQYNTPSQYGSAGHDTYGSASYSTPNPSTDQTGYSGYDYTTSTPQAGYTTQQEYSTTQQAYSTTPAGYSATSAGYPTTPATYSATQHEYSTTQPNYSTHQQEYDTSADYDASSASADYTQTEAQYYQDPAFQT
ncbi:hypothetical protein V8F06_002810 [Rhypophila decipiens]